MPPNPHEEDRGPAPIRTMRDDDIPAVVALINAADAVDGADEGTSEAEFRLWVGQQTDPHNHFVAVTPDGTLVGYGDVHHQPGDEGARGWVVVAPAWRRHGIGHALVDCVRARARRTGLWWVDFAIDVRLIPATIWIERLGYEPVRTYTRLRLPSAAPLPVAPPADDLAVAIRTFQPGHDEAAVHGILNASFADHRNANVVTTEQMAATLGRPGFDPAGLFLAEIQEGDAKGEVIGLCWCYINPHESTRRCEQVGWINDLGVDPAYRRLGLGRALLAHGIAWLRAQSVDCVELWVEGNNREANRLYQTTGFHVNKTVVDYRHFLPVRREPA